MPILQPLASGGKLLKKFDQNFLQPFGRLDYRHLRVEVTLAYFFQFLLYIFPSFLYNSLLNKNKFLSTEDRK